MKRLVIKRVDALIEKLNAVYRKFADKKVLPSERLSKAEQLNELFTAIRQLQIKSNLKPLLRQSKILNKQIEKTIEIYKTKFAGQDPSQFTQKEINDFAEELQTAQDALNTYVSLDVDLSSLFTEKLSEEDAKLEADLVKTSNDARKLQALLSEILDKYTSEINEPEGPLTPNAGCGSP